MSKYTTGEIAKLCGVTVRTVQYYDTRGNLVPSELSEGGRRLTSETNLRGIRIFPNSPEIPFFAFYFTRLATTTKRPSPVWWLQEVSTRSSSPYSARTPVSYSAAAMTWDTYSLNVASSVRSKY